MNDSEAIERCRAAKRKYDEALQKETQAKKAFNDMTDLRVSAQREVERAQQDLLNHVFPPLPDYFLDDANAKASKLLNKILDDPALLHKLLPPVCTCTSLLGQRDPQCPVHGGK